MKKNGFTLAEVLITLAIIGVVATLTLPALTNNTGEQQAKTALKKGINILTEAAQMNQAIAGYDYASLTSSDTKSQDQGVFSLYSLLYNRAAVDPIKSEKVKIESHQGKKDNAASGNYTLFFRDGTALIYNASGTINDSVYKMEDDGMVHGIPVIFDTNGSKGPNILSNCSGNALGNATDKGSSSTCTQAKRVIKDQFGVRLRGATVVPNGAAAKWAYEN